MKAEELRIGNWVINPVPFQHRQIDHLDIRDLAESRLNFPFEPIPLTEEWLLKFGFEKRPAKKKRGEDNFHQPCTTFDLDDLTFENTSENKFILSLVNDCNSDFYCDQSPTTLDHIKYVHQLQNLYFALTGEELTIKE